MNQRLGDRALFPGQVKEPDIAKHPIWPGRVGITDCDDAVDRHRALSNQILNFGQQPISGGLIDRIVRDALDRRYRRITPLPSGEGEGEITVDDGQAIGSFERPLDDEIFSTRGPSLLGALFDVTATDLKDSDLG